MRRQALREAKQDLRMFWAVHRAAAAIMGEAGAEGANEYIQTLSEFIHGPKPVDRAAIDAVLNAIGAKPQ